MVTPADSQNQGASRASNHWLSAKHCQVSDLHGVVEASIHPEDCPHAQHIQLGVPVYDCTSLRATLDASGSAEDVRRELMAEWAWVWQDGPGVLVLKGAFDDLALIDAATVQFQAMIDDERLTGSGGDHFAKPGANDRVWNALEKMCLRAPEVFAAYYANDMLAMASQAWLGPAYQMTSQVNCVNPGGAAQMAHRDYHLGFCTADEASHFPVAVHRLSPYLTLQGAVAHVDMPLESGPTLYLPHSQKYQHGYLVAGHQEFQNYFDAHHVQLPLQKGDAVFFNPALMHAAGNNRTADVRRMGNLLQVSSAFGRAMESVDRTRMSQALYPHLKAALRRGWPQRAVDNVIAASAEGYAFPTNLDRDPPLGGLAPESQQSLMRRALGQAWSEQQFIDALRMQAGKKSS